MDKVRVVHLVHTYFTLLFLRVRVMYVDTPQFGGRINYAKHTTRSFAEIIGNDLLKTDC